MSDIIKKGSANHWLNGEAVGGWLQLDAQQLHFTSHCINFQPHKSTISLADISHVEFYRTLGIAPNGLRICLRDGQCQEFVVNNRSQWKQLVDQHFTA